MSDGPPSVTTFPARSVFTGVAGRRTIHRPYTGHTDRTLEAYLGVGPYCTHNTDRTPPGRIQRHTEYRQDTERIPGRRTSCKNHTDKALKTYPDAGRLDRGYRRQVQDTQAASEVHPKVYSPPLY